MAKQKLSPEAIEKRRVRNREAKRKILADPVLRDKLNEQKRAYYLKNKDKFKQYTKEFYERHGIKQSSYRAKRRDPELFKQAYTRWNKKRVCHYIAEFRNGRLSLDELNRRIGLSIIRTDERYRSQRLKRCERDLQLCETDSQLNAVEVEGLISKARMERE